MFFPLRIMDKQNEYNLVGFKKKVGVCCQLQSNQNHQSFIRSDKTTNILKFKIVGNVLYGGKTIQIVKMEETWIWYGPDDAVSINT